MIDFVGIKLVASSYVLVLVFSKGTQQLYPQTFNMDMEITLYLWKFYETREIKACSRVA